MVRTHESLCFQELDFALDAERARPNVDVLQLGASLRKSVKRVGTKAKAYTKRLVRKSEKAFVKAAPVLGVAAQALNLIVPGLGVAVGLAINVGAQALAAHDAKKAYEKAEKEASAEERAEIEAARKEAQEVLDKLGPEADKATMDAFLKGEAYFTKTYRVTREEFQSWPLQTRYRFLMGSVYDLNKDKFAAKGVTREEFLSMPMDRQTQLLDTINRESGIVTSEQASASMGKGTWTTVALVGGGAALALLVVILLIKRVK